MDAQRKTESALFDHSKNEKIFPSLAKSSVIMKKAQLFCVISVAILPTSRNFNL
jgi:hypothetical protein